MKGVAYTIIEIGAAVRDAVLIASIIFTIILWSDYLAELAKKGF